MSIPNDRAISAAVLALRQNMKLSQQGLSNRLDVAAGTVYKYETGRIPEPKSLTQLVLLAREYKCWALEAIFRERLFHDLGITAENAAVVFLSAARAAR